MRSRADAGTPSRCQPDTRDDDGDADAAAIALVATRDVRSSPVRDILELTQRAEVISFAGGLPAPELFPAELIADAFSSALAPTVAARALQYSATDGDPQLRTLLAARFSGRGLATQADDVLVTTGSQQALGLVSSVLVDPGDVVLVENPSYLAALQCFAFAGATARCGRRVTITGSTPTHCLR